jgi:hypothetical protein
MPQTTKNEPDYIDVGNILRALSESYQVVVYYGIRFRADYVEVTGKTHGAPYTPDAPVEHVALSKIQFFHKANMAVTLYTLAFDLWCQHDGGGATAARRGPPTDWAGRVEIPRRRRF